MPKGMPAEMWCIIRFDWWSKVSRRYQASITDTVAPVKCLSSIKAVLAIVAKEYYEIEKEQIKGA